ncbi:DMT family transporter [Rhodobacter capsulatus]|uniref:DMT family transporter n=1 Tax=Rhodobacter capsulatus TaxID=1061 RepID=UPI0003D2A320|nr:DMT family transporter [Rhodobacter capsulatus]ETD85037.1 membrane protein [Rhodobacter capsulatus B6]ETD85106.1 membrane protein [Rhodobacter capsulatus YW1]ETD89644.1 membrane protein [Rhodobacter capsulatus YW2]TQD35558.1 DMT family transporter [Rhodobacter capsulatus]
MSAPLAAVGPPPNPVTGITLKILSVLVFIAMSTVIKVLAPHVPPGETVFFRSLFAIPVILAWLLWRRELSVGLKVRQPMGHVWRGVAGTSAMGLGFAGLAFLPLPEVTALGYAAPLLTVIFAAMFLGEEVRAFRLSAVTLGLIGVLIVLWPRLGSFEGGNPTATLGAMLVIMGATFAALAQVFIRKMVATERTSAIVFWFSVTSTGLSLISVPFGWVVPTPYEATLLISCGILGGIGQILLTSSYRFADASIVAPFEYVSMLFALGIGYWMFAEVPTVWMLGGAGLIIAAGVMIIWRERRLGLERQRARKAVTPQG